MEESSLKALTVFDFKEEDEVVESASGQFVGKFRNPQDDNPSITKYDLIERLAQGNNVQQMEISNVSCVDVDESNDNHKFNDCSSHVMGTSEGECAFKQKVSGLDAVRISKSTSYDPNTHIGADNLETGSLFSGGTSLAMEVLSLGVPSAENKQINCTFLDHSFDNESVDGVSDDDESMKTSFPSTSSELAENEVSLEERASDHCDGSWEMDHINMAVIVSPDFVRYGDAYFTESRLTFSCSYIKLEGSIACGNMEPLSSEWEIGDVIDIESQWCGMVGTALVRFCLKATDAVGAENAHGALGIVKLVFAVSDPKWSEKQEKITSLHARYKAQWNVVFDTEMVKEKGDFVGQSNRYFPKSYYPNFDEAFEDVIYPKGDPDAVSISKRDVELLQPETFINDTIIDFYIKYLKNEIQPEDKHRFHFFNSFFFRKMADLDKDPSSALEGRAAFLRVRKWTRKVNLFEKDYIFIPVNFNLHWSLIVICHPGEVVNFIDEDIDKSPKVPCILHFDSIKGSHKGLKNLFQSYLWEEWKERQKESLEDVSSKFFNLRFVSLELPQQENSFDCGLFLLHYVELFLEEAPINFSPFKITKFSQFLNMDWFPPAEASLKRAFIQKLIYKIHEDHSQKVPSAACDDEHRDAECLENNNEKENGIEFISGKCSPAKTCHGNSSFSTGEQGIEIKLLARSPQGDVQCGRDSGLVFRELFNPGAAAASFPDGQYQPFDQIAPFHRFKSAISPIEEDSETGKQFVYSPSGEAGYQPVAGLTNEACMNSTYSSKDFEALETLLNSRISMQLKEHEDVDSSPDPSGCGSSNSSEIGVDEPSPIRHVVGQNQQEETQKLRSVSPENIECVTKSPASASGGKLETDIVQDYQVVDRMANSNESDNSLTSCQENPIASSLQADFTENMDFTVNDRQLSNDDPVSESFEQQASKRPRLMPPLEGES